MLIIGLYFVKIVKNVNLWESVVSIHEIRFDKNDFWAHSRNLDTMFVTVINSMTII